MVKSRWCDYSNAYIFGGEAITVVGQGVGAATIASDKNNKVIFKNCWPFINCISEINNTQVDNNKDLDIVIPMYNSKK